MRADLSTENDGKDTCLCKRWAAGATVAQEKADVRTGDFPQWQGQFPRETDS